MKIARRFLPAPRLAIALAALGASLSLRCSSEAIGTDPPEGGASGAAGAPSGDEPGGAPSSGAVCDPFATRECIGPAACRGGQTCSKDGSAWGGCDCGDGPGAAGAGAGTGGAPGGAEGGGGGSGGTSVIDPVACKPAPQSGCEADEKCTLVLDQATESVTFQCVPNGTKADGAACALRPDGTDDCAKGYFCNGLGTVPRCQPYCDVDDAEACDTLCTELNVQPHAGAATPSGYGVCQPPCDMLAQDCGDGDACVFVESPFPVCAKPGTAEPGDTCVNYNDCELGSACALNNAAQTASMCTPFCAATEAGSCEAEGDTCVAFPMVYNGVPAHLLTTGLCYPCALLGMVECELLAPGGCTEETDCDPLLESMGFEFTCDTRASVCVMAEPR